MRPAHRSRQRLVAVLLACSTVGPARAQTFVNWETPHVSPLTISPNGELLLAVNTADNRLEVFDIAGDLPAPLASIPVGLDPVSVRARTDAEVWVVNHISDSISIVSLPERNVRRTLVVGDEPADVIFAAAPQRAFVTLSQLNQVRIYDPLNLGAAPQIINLEGEDPRALATNADRTQVYVAIFESGNNSTLVPRGAVSSPAGPYGGLNPPPNAGNVFSPPLAPGLPPPPPVALIVKRNSAGQWIDDNTRNWSAQVAWALHDHDVAIIDAATLAVTYASGMMNMVAGIGVTPAGEVTVVGADATNEVRFEENLNGRFLRVLLGRFQPAAPATTALTDLNPHLTYTSASVPPEQRALSLGDPRAIVWTPDGGRGYVAGMGSNSVLIIDAAGAPLARVAVGAGPTGLALAAAAQRLYVLNKFDATISVIDTATNVELTQLPLHDPTPVAIRLGRPFLYDTQLTSGAGHISCASCHIDGRGDSLAWDLGSPAGQMKPVNQPCRQGPGNCTPWHPLKGPMVTQSLQGIIGAEPLHWRGDKENLAAFNIAYTNLQGRDSEITPAEMADLTDFVATIRYGPNPNRNLDNTLRTAVGVTGGQTGNAQNGLNLFNTAPIFGGALTCIACHSLPTGTDRRIDDPPGGPEPQSLKNSQMRGLQEKTGFSLASQNNNRGFGYNHDGSAANLGALLAGPPFTFPPGPTGQAQRRDLEAFMLSLSNDTHAGVGVQVTVDGVNNNGPALVTQINQLLTLAGGGQVGLVVKGRQAGLERGYRYNGGNVFQSDRAGETISATVLRQSAGAGDELTWTLVPAGSQTRIGIDRDGDGFFDRDELDGCGDPANATITPGHFVRGDGNCDGAVDFLDIDPFLAALFNPVQYAAAHPNCSWLCAADCNVDGRVDFFDIDDFLTILFP